MCMCTVRQLQEGNVLGVLSLRDRDEEACFCISACFKKPPDAAFLKINTLTLGRFYAFFSFSQGYHFPSGYYCQRLSKFTSNKPSYKVKIYIRELLCRFITSTNTSAHAHTTAEEHKMWSGKIMYSSIVSKSSALNKQQVRVTLMPQCGQFSLLFRLLSAWQPHYISLYDRAVRKGKDFVTNLMNVYEHIISAVRMD